MNKKSMLFTQIQEPYAAGLFEEPERNAFARYGRAVRRYLEQCSLHPYNGEPLYPMGAKCDDSYGVRPDYSFTVALNEDVLKEKNSDALQWMQEEMRKLPRISSPHTVGGAGYTHSIPNYGRIAREGLDSYEARILALAEGDFQDGLLDTLAGIRCFHNRALVYLEQKDADPMLIQALKRVPFQPAQTLYEAIVCWNFVYYLDFCDNPGLMDSDLMPFYKGEDVTDILRVFFQNVDTNSGWSSALGPNYNPLTLQCIQAAKGLRRPSLELRVTQDMPDNVWDTAAETLIAGGGQPAFYNEHLYQKALRERFPHIPKEDLIRFNGGGCTETMLAGISNVGSLDAGINLALIFALSLRAHLKDAIDYHDLYTKFLQDARKTIAETLDLVSENQKKRSEVRPQPMRSLLIDDCIDKGTDFNAGGARYYWSVVNVAGMINVIDSLVAVRELVFDKKKYTPEEFLKLLEEEDEIFYSELKKCPHFGVDNTQADQLAATIAQDIWKAFDQRTPWLGGAFLPSSIQFSTYVDAGRNVGSTPDGRKKGDPLCDSIAAIHGNDVKGPTAMLSSSSRLHLDQALGTPVTNLKLNREHVGKVLKPLVLGYFKQGGMQLQITCVSKADLLDAKNNPENHMNLIVRIGGFSEYFNRLSPELQQTVIERTEF